MALHTPSDRTFEERTSPIPEEAKLIELLAERRAAVNGRHDRALLSKILRVGSYLRRRDETRPDST